MVRHRIHLQQQLDRDLQAPVQARDRGFPDPGIAMPQLPGMLTGQPGFFRQFPDRMHVIAFEELL
jgi:hypothetical protein